MKPGDGLRDLARKIEEVAREHPEWSRAHEIVLHCTGYLQAVARCSDFNVERHDDKPIVVGVATDGSLVTSTDLPDWPFKDGERK